MSRKHPEDRDKWLGLNVKEFWDFLARRLQKQEEDRAKKINHDSREAIAYLKNLQLASRPQILVDCGCGACVFEPSWARAADEVVGVDVSPERIRDGQKRIKKSGIQNVHLIVCDVCYLPLREEISDATFSLGVLRHLPLNTGYNAIREMCRITKGKLYVNDIPNLFHLEAILYKIGKFFYTRMLKRRAMGVFYYNPFELEKLLVHWITGRSFRGFNCRLFPVGFLPFCPQFLKKLFHIPLFSNSSENSRTPTVDFRILQFSTLEFTGTKTLCRQRKIS